MRFFRDQNGIATAEGEPALLANFLQGDIQDDAQTARQLLERIDLILNAGSGRCEFSGNAHEVEIDARRTTIELADDEDEERAHLPTQDFRQTLSAWLTFIQHA